VTRQLGLGRRFRRFGNSGGASLWSVNYTAGTFARSSETTYRTAAATVDPAAPHAIIFEDFGDGAGALLSICGEFINYARQGRALQLSPWATIGAPTVTADYVAGPDGRLAVRIECPTGTNRRQNVSASPTSVPQCLSAWVRSPIGGGGAVCITDYTGGATSNLRSAGISSPGTTWQRLVVMEDSYGSSGSSIYLAESVDRSTLGGLTGGTRDGVYDLVQLELSRYPRRVMRTQTSTSETSKADTLAFTSGQVDARLFTDAAEFSQASPYFANTDLVSGDQRWLLSIAGSSNGIRLRHNGTDVRIEAVSGGVVVAQSGALTFSKNALLGVVAWDPVTAVVSVGGVAGSAGTPWSWTPASVRIGGIHGGAVEFDGRLGVLGQSGATSGLGSTRRSIDVMWIGDSITAAGTATFARWRKIVQDLANARAENQWYNPVGPLASAATAWDLDKSLSQNGATTATVNGWLTTYSMPAGYSPDIIPILIGTNDIGVDGDTNATLATQMGTMIDNIAAAFPNALLVLQKLLPRSDGSGAQVTDWNANHHAGVVTAAQGRSVNIISDDTIATLPGVTYVDSVHPNVAAEAAIGAAMETALRGWAGVT
jgi:lysophospholipase L1-like esterase